jgi:tellurite resistance protein
MAMVAGADGDDEREIILMQQFWEACSPEIREAESLDEVRRSPFDLAAARQALDTPLLQQMFLASCLLVAYADGAVSAAEQATIGVLIERLGISAELSAATHERVTTLLVEQLSRVSDLETLQKIARQL